MAQSATEEYKVETKTSKRRCKLWSLVLILIISVIILIAITLAVIYTSRSSDSQYNDIVSVSAHGSLRIFNRNFTPELNESHSVEYEELESAFKLMMDIIFLDSDLASSYNSTQIESFRSGSVIVIFRIILTDIPRKFIALPFTSHNLIKTKDHIRHIINMTIHQHATEAGAEAGIKVDLNSLTIQEVSIQQNNEIKDIPSCRLPKEDEYIYLKEGDVMNVTSPCYPEEVELPNGISRVFIAPEGCRIIISFSEFKLEDEVEYLYLGSETEPDVVGTFIARFTGYDFPPDVMSAGPGLWIRSWSFADVNYGGFEAKMTVVKNEMVDFECPPNTEPCRYALECYSEEEQCDGHLKCPSGTDEIGCACYPPLSYYKCSDGRCLSRQYICNGPQGCSDDEAYCVFTCPNGKNITEVFMCDGFNDCGDYADERQNCSCDSEDQWECPDGTCIYKHNVCDGFPHCPGREDEMNCQCESWQFQCGDGRCIPYWDRCDGNDTCADKSDEQNCPKCPGRLFQCASFQCLSKDLVCNGEEDCFGGDDERDCPPPATCSGDEFTCGDGKCLRSALVCDLIPQCINGTDEAYCHDDEECEFRCNNGECIPADWICDGVEDCLEGEDEPDCAEQQPEPCEEGFFRCPDRQCIPDILICNGIRDCKGSADEQNCTENALDLCQGFDENDYFVCDGKEDCPNGDDEKVCTVCGKRPAGRLRRRRMLGGREASVGEWPWQIYLASQNDTEGVSCGGTVVNRKWIITAAHCISTFQIGRMVVITGVSDRFELGEHGQLVHISDVYEHPDFYFSGYYLLYDVALVQLREPLVMTDYVRPVCLPDSGFELEPGTYLTSTGYGETGAGTIASSLMETRLPLIPSEVCVRWTQHSLEDVLKIVCVGYENGVQGPCYGDSGGPLVVEKDGSWYIIGIVSGGAECGAPYSPNFYTRVTELLEWIDDVINLR
ncbi:atrial natriuretic peptide-converting enzyme-like [Lytechinus pictus]|uniref:atrial natriuretic peptide-converting enzyme-like n=1 Tax=Lytechinus pictus TaxID=7653 RepID=UPI0030B9D7CF